ncbi:MAG TPA: LacI family DNA-binding transcriptional regulator [Candidatus Baltobacteraceae bacterium]|nr:LacI family DNA-binding transcriptional regulator [Candidatus Baltobacteraceae bacterium]
MSARLRDVAQSAGVSVATASRVLSGNAVGVAATRREAVLAAARTLHYVPNAHAQALARAGTAHIGAILHDVSDPYFSEIVRGLQRAAADADRLVTVCNSYRDPERELAYVGLLRSQRVGALILTGSGLDDRSYSERLAPQIGAFAATGGRPVFIGRHHVAGDAVLPDNVGGARALARALVELGHRRFAIVNGPPLLTTTRDRIDGFASGLADFGLSIDPADVVPGDFSREGGISAMTRLLDANTRATCVFALNDAMALGALRVLRARGVAVPEAISLAGFDDIPAALDCDPTLSTVRIPLAEMGAMAVALALEPPSAELRVRHVRAEVLLRGSTAPPAR